MNVELALTPDEQAHLRAYVNGLKNTTTLDARLEQAFLTTPRHYFVSDLYIYDSQESRFVKMLQHTDPERWLAYVYSDAPLIAALGGDGLPIVTGTMPSLMMRMLSVAHITPADRVLDVGTGTGYAAALMARLAHAGRIDSVDIHCGSVRAAQNASRRLGLRNIDFHCLDARLPMSLGSSMDVIFAAVGCRRVPQHWFESLAADGRLITAFQGRFAGGVVALSRQDSPGGWAGQFLATEPVGFVELRTASPPPPPAAEYAPHLPLVGDRHTPLVPGLWQDLQPASESTFLLWLQWAQQHLKVDWYPDDAGEFVVAVTMADHSSAARLAHDASGGVTAQHLGSHEAWDTLEKEYQSWISAGRPGLARYRLEIKNGRHVVVVSEPEERRFVLAHE